VSFSGRSESRSHPTIGGTGLPRPSEHTGDCQIFQRADHKTWDPVRSVDYDLQSVPVPQILILTAVQIEAKAVARALGLARQGDFWRDRDLRICLRTIGIGSRDLPALEPSTSPEFVILAGLAGALSPSLKVGDVVIDECPTGLKDGFSGHFGKIHSTDRLVATPQAKSELFASTHAIAVEMEAQAVRPWVSQLPSAFVLIRSISDSASEGINPRLLRLVDHHGRARPGAIAVELIRSPRLIPELLHLASNSRKSSLELGKAVKWIVNRIQK